MKLVLDNGKEVVLYGELKEQLEKVIEDNAKENPYREPEKGELCYYIMSNGKPKEINYDKALYGEAYNRLKILVDKETAEREAFRDKVDKELLKFSMENDGYKIDWDDKTERKWSIYYDYSDNELYIGEDHDCRSQGVTYFYREKTSNQAIDLFREDLIKYFKM